MPANKKKKKQKRNAGTVSVGILVIAFAIVMSVQIVKLKQKDEKYIANEQEKQQQLDDEQARATELQELEEYMNSEEYIVDTAHSVFGLVFDNEIIYKEKKE